MARSKTGTVRKNKHRKTIKATKGYSGTRSKLFKRANEAFIKAGENKFKGRKLKKRDIKKLWIIRINAALKDLNIKYSEFSHKLKNSKIDLDRKILAELAIKQPETFKKVVEKVTKG